MANETKSKTEQSLQDEWHRARDFFKDTGVDIDAGFTLLRQNGWKPELEYPGSDLEHLRFSELHDEETLPRVVVFSKHGTNEVTADVGFQPSTADIFRGIEELTPGLFHHIDRVSSIGIEPNGSLSITSMRTNEVGGSQSTLFLGSDTSIQLFHKVLPNPVKVATG